MAKVSYPEPIDALINALKKLPGIGPRSAERIAIWFLQNKKGNAPELAAALTGAIAEVLLCEHCGFFATKQGCVVCDAANRDDSVLCVVEQATDVLPLERAGVFQGRYHCLGGKLSPLDHVTPEDLRIGTLLKRVKNEGIQEVILALESDVEGEATSHYLRNLLKEYPCSVTQLAQGLPVGGGLEHADELTLSRALAGRKPMD